MAMNNGTYLTDELDGYWSRLPAYSAIFNAFGAALDGVDASASRVAPQDGSQVGGFDFTTNDGRIGSCAIDIDFSASLSTGRPHKAV